MKKIWYMFVLVAIFFAACEPMDDNYKEYIERHTTYAEKLTIAETGYMSVPEAGSITIYWTLPKSSRINGMKIIHKVTEDEQYVVDLTLAEAQKGEYTFTDLLIQSHEFIFYTVDAFGNLSVPVSVSLIPLTERNGDAERTEAADDESGEDENTDEDE